MYLPASLQNKTLTTLLKPPVCQFQLRDKGHVTENPNKSGKYIFSSRVISFGAGIPGTQVVLALCSFIFRLWPLFPCLIEWLLELQPSHSSSMKEETLLAKGLFRKAHPMTFIPETRIVLEAVIIRRDHFHCHQSVGSAGKKRRVIR